MDNFCPCLLLCYHLRVQKICLTFNRFIENKSFLQRTVSCNNKVLYDKTLRGKVLFIRLLLFSFNSLSAKEYQSLGKWYIHIQYPLI